LPFDLARSVTAETASFRRFFGFRTVLVLSEAVLVIVIDVGVILPIRFRDPAPVHRHRRL
jgi:hypothetical protein